MINLLHKKSENNMCKKDIANWKNEETCDIQDEQNEERNRDGLMMPAVIFMRTFLI